MQTQSSECIMNHKRPSPSISFTTLISTMSTQNTLDLFLFVREFSGFKRVIELHLKRELTLEKI